ncbi:hypothetical protein DFH09DRAFT_1310527 [Mycena vulgaris]|nr:hypothetical protein DFH09DRAFT_1310527 [Mycena vulgaris]
MVKVSPKLRGVWRSPPHFRVPVREKPLSRGMVSSLSANAKKKAGAKRFYVLATSSEEAEPMWVVHRGDSFDCKDFEFPNVFPNGCTSVSVTSVPGTDMVLQSPWRIYFDTGRYAAPLNQCVKRKFNVDWTGNILMIKHRRRSECIAQVSYGEEDFADVILGLWLKEFFHVKNRLGVKLHFKSSL